MKKTNEKLRSDIPHIIFTVISDLTYNAKVHLKVQTFSTIFRSETEFILVRARNVFSISLRKRCLRWRTPAELA